MKTYAVISIEEGGKWYAYTAALTPTVNICTLIDNTPNIQSLQIYAIYKMQGVYLDDIPQFWGG